jgi:hypothetical protein
MNVYEELKAALKVTATHGLQGSSRSTWRIGEGRVTTEEIESWQLGPDLSAPRRKSPPRSIRRRPS